MKRETYFKLLLLMVVTFGFTACTIENDDEVGYNTTEDLCSKTWVETYVTTDHYYCTHKIIFDYDGDAQEVYIYNNMDINGNPLSTVAETRSKSLSWSWYNENHECLVLNYGKNVVSYFDNVWVRNDYLSGKLDGIYVTFMNDNI